ncbi:MAG TPA: DUF3592 domain-containing protein [Reyranella sp.]
MSGTNADRGNAVPELLRACVGALLALSALALWSYRDVVSSWFATSYTATIELTTTTERDDKRVERAFATAQSARPGEATFELVPGLSQIRHSVVHVTGPSRTEAIAAAESLSQSMVAAFDAEGSGRLDASVRRRAYPAPGPTSTAVLAILAYGAPLLALVGIALLWLGWRDWPADADGMPRAAVFTAIGFVSLSLVPFVMPGWMVMALFAMAIPGAIAGTIVYKMRELRRTAQWPSAQGRIVRSGMRTVRRKQAGEATKVGNVPAVEYVFSVDGVEYSGHRIGVGDITASSPQAEAVLERYRVGRTGPVFYNPDKPEEAVLERDPPARPAVVYGIAAGVMLVGLAVVVTFTQASEIIGWLEPYFPPGAVVQGVLFCTAAGILMALFLVSDRRTATAAARWPTTPGTILSSIAESHRTLVPRGRGQTIVVWSPVVEYSYGVDGRNYHSSRLAFGGDVASSRAFADEIVARYPVGHEVTVHFDPANPSFAVLEPRVAFAWSTFLLTVAFFAAALFFSGWRG